jgi:AI-2E family transporter
MSINLLKRFQTVSGGDYLVALSLQAPTYDLDLSGTSSTTRISGRSRTTGRTVGGYDRDGDRRVHCAFEPRRPSSAPSSSSPQASPPGAPAPAAAQATGSSPFELVERYISTVLSPFATLGIVFIVAVFALLQKEDLRDRLIRLVGSDDIHRTTRAIDDGAHRLSRYFLTQLIINGAFGAIIGGGLLLIGLPNPVLWGILSALLRFVPYSAVRRPCVVRAFRMRSNSSAVRAPQAGTAAPRLSATVDAPTRWRRWGRVVGMTTKIAGEPHTPRESWDPNRQICYAAWLTSIVFCATNGARGQIEAT